MNSLKTFFLTLLSLCIIALGLAAWVWTKKTARKMQVEDMKQLSAAYFVAIQSNPSPTLSDLQLLVEKSGKALNYSRETNYRVFHADQLTNGDAVVIQSFERHGNKERVLEARADGSISVRWAERKD